MATLLVPIEADDETEVASGFTSGFGVLATNDTSIMGVATVTAKADGGSLGAAEREKIAAFLEPEIGLGATHGAWGDLDVSTFFPFS